MITATSEMVERVARAIVARGAAAGSTGPDDLAEVIEASWRAHVEIARAAIAAMREPTESMVLGLVIEKCRPDNQHERDVATLDWQFMIDKALAGE